MPKKAVGVSHVSACAVCCTRATIHILRREFSTGNTSGYTPAVIRTTPRQGKVKGNSFPLPSLPLSASKARVSLEQREIPLGFPHPQEFPRGIPRMLQNSKMIQITPGIVQEIPMCPRSDPVKMWPRRFCATISNRTPTHPAILRMSPGSNALWQDNLIAIGIAPPPCKPLLLLGQQRCP